ncbi:hypothetical protein ACIP6T_12485 [Pantoea sp. NPDC088449]|uniref:Uncharacterized protein n=1 Tax=Candidatus Pantoea floridensis TaxID=1938870 RepID=A0A286DP43_9GAMM|nr:hypothetical protein [Pantoea floridensis]PIF15109.1 hypothetical protein BX596_4217 [Enterobacteriaceae bacterium JKS000233]SOD60373.1 hypothetical protein SAMN06273570_4677 [Pantoea floridensis]
MASYTIRIELKEPTASMQIELLYAMLENGFSRSLVCEKGYAYVLPVNEFVYVGTENIRSLTDRIVNLVNDFSEDPAVLITQSAARCWSGLRGVNLA